MERQPSSAPLERLPPVVNEAPPPAEGVAQDGGREDAQIEPDDAAVVVALPDAPAVVAGVVHRMIEGVELDEAGPSIMLPLSAHR